MRTHLGLGGTVAIAVLAMLALAAGAVLGHADLVSSDPADGATIKTPYTLTATFSEELTPNGSSIKVQAANGTEVGSGTVSTTDDKQMTIDLSVLPEAEYEVLWTAVTADDQGITRGTYHFTVSTTAASAAPTAAASLGASAAATPAPASSPTPTSVPIDDGGAGISLAVVAALVIVLAIAGFFIYRNRS